MSDTILDVATVLNRLGGATAPEVARHVPQASIGDASVVLEALEARGRVHKLPPSCDRRGWAVNVLSYAYN